MNCKECQAYPPSQECGECPIYLADEEEVEEKSSNNCANRITDIIFSQNNWCRIHKSEDGYMYMCEGVCSDWQKSE